MKSDHKVERYDYSKLGPNDSIDWDVLGNFHFWGIHKKNGRSVSIPSASSRCAKVTEQRNCSLMASPAKETQSICFPQSCIEMTTPSTFSEI